MTALHMACWQGKKEEVEWLLDQGAHLHAKDGRGWSPLHLACLRGHANLLAVILARQKPEKRKKGNLGPVSWRPTTVK